MDSKSVHRVAQWANCRSHYDSKLKRWTFDQCDDQGRPTGQLVGSFSVEEIANMASPELRKRLKPSLRTEGEVPPATSSSIVDAAAAIESGKPAAKAVKKKKPVAAAKAPRAPKQKKQGKRESNVVKISAAIKKTPKRVAKADEGKHWLKKIGIDKSQLKRKGDLLGASVEQKKLLKDNTQYYTKSELRALASVIFSDSDKATLKAREQHSAYAVKCAEEARDLCEAVLALK